MPADTPVIASGNGQGKTRLLTRDRSDGRTKARKQFDSIAEGIAATSGGEDRAQHCAKAILIEAFAGAAVHMHDLNARLLLGEEVDYHRTFLKQSQPWSALLRGLGSIG